MAPMFFGLVCAEFRLTGPALEYELAVCKIERAVYLSAWWADSGCDIVSVCVQWEQGQLF